MALGLLWVPAGTSLAANKQPRPLPSKAQPADANVRSAGQVPVDFAREVLPILSDKCFVCHGPDGTEREAAQLDSYEAATRRVDGRAAIDLQDLSQSGLLLRIHDRENPMPPVDAEKQLTDQDRNVLTRWIQQGGAYAMHWSFVPPAKPQVPESVSTPHPIDAFVARKLRERGLTLAPPADLRTRARRAALVLTGLPPEPAWVEQLVRDERPNAFEIYIDRLLASPRYGEHQARYWLDAVRYGDTHGLHLDNRRGIYPYRDWVVQAFNRNLPLDDFITWQLAGDLLPDPTLEQLVATGYVRMNPTTSEGGVIPAEFQAKNNFDRVETLGTVFLGMTLTCARCHSHKYDPISQTEYYQLLAFFNSTAESPLDGNKYDYGPVVKAPQDGSGWQAWYQLQQQQEALLRQFDDILGDSPPAGEEMALWRKANRDGRWQMLLTGKLPLPADGDQQAQCAIIVQSALALQERIAALEKSFTTTLVARDLPQPRETRLLRRGEYDLPTGELLTPATFQIMGAFPPDSARNRLGLAQWLTSREHPLVARVMVNRIWQRVFGYGLVRTPEDFGLQGEQPTHPELLDWLAVELQDRQWNLKQMLKLMVTSQTFAQSSVHRADIEDPENRLLARGPGYRLDAEVIRDIGLWASGLLDPQLGGEGVKPYQPKGLWAALMHPASNTKLYVQDQGNKLYRRSLYVYWKRTSPHPMMTLFDAPSRESSCVRRSRTNTSLQSLGLLNETQRIEMARKLAERLLTEADSDADRLDRLFQRLATRSPTSSEEQVCLNLLRTMRQRYRDRPQDAELLLDVGDAAVSEEFEASELSAWTQVASTVLASDLAILLY